MRSRTRAILFGGLLLTGGLAAWFLPVEAWVLSLADSIRSTGVLGVALYAAVYTGATLTMMPGSILGMIAGFAYGPVVGVLIVSPVSVLASSLAFLLGRTVAREWVAKKVASSPRWSAIDAAISDDGPKVVLLLRLSPLFPYNVLNYALGLTGVRFRDYVLASFLGMLPGTVLYVYVGSLVTTTSQFLSGELPEVGPWGWASYVFGLLATIAVTIIVARKAQGELSQIIAQRSTTAVTEGPEVSEPPNE
jgi:uncharacterized membrane protein YdjX (TVP38/TMEM64 family)